MKVLITGSNGFLAKNMIEHLKRDESIELYLYSKKDSINLLEAYVKEVDFIFHLAGVNRPKDASEFYEGNSNLTKMIVEILKEANKNTPILLSSSIQAELNNDYGKSKLEAENILLDYAKETGALIYIYRLPNIFGKWCKPNYNSVVATWCYNIANNIEIHVSDRSVELTLVHVDDVVKSFISKLDLAGDEPYVCIETVYKKTLGEIESLLYQFKENRKTLLIPNVGRGFERALYGTYLSYLSPDDFSYELKGHQDDRGTFYEILKTLDSGQFSLSTTAPGVTRGNHYHHTKNEKFLVVKGEAVIEFRHIMTHEIISYKVSDKKMEIVEMIPGYTHNIKNTGDEEMILFLWANESFDQDNPDTYFLEV
ncbi:polysaccharide biosynthesis C-terminal domain-containing protein [Sulfurospirillum sp. 1612]|uniref:polysaccharide biosynthesis C-terminal domain-containing protein n=1 Tax=Sulfurospirillum sp. 1612 TaxID=3094835 RepID=UPI002F93095A